MKTYSAFYVRYNTRALFEKKPAAEMYGQLPVGVRIINRKVDFLDDIKASYQCFMTREGPIIVLVEDQPDLKIRPDEIQVNYCSE